MATFSKKNLTSIVILILAMIFLIITIITWWFPLDVSIKFFFINLVALILPGLFTSFILYPETKPIKDPIKTKKSTRIGLDWLERIIFSVFISITLITLFFIALQWFHVTVTPIILDFVIIFVNIVTGTGAVIALKRHRANQPH